MNLTHLKKFIRKHSELEVQLISNSECCVILSKVIEFASETVLGELDRALTE
jgi:hypothetical protein